MHAAGAARLVMEAMAMCRDEEMEAFYRFGILEKGNAYLFNLVHILEENITDVANAMGVQVTLLAMRVCPDVLIVQEDSCAVLATIAEYGAFAAFVHLTLGRCGARYLFLLCRDSPRRPSPAPPLPPLPPCADEACRTAIRAEGGIALIRKAMASFPDAPVLCECADMIVALVC